MKNEEKKAEEKWTPVFHANGTHDLKRKNGEYWIDYWERITGKKRPQICPCCKTDVNNDKDNHIVGAHVYKVMDDTNSNRIKYIVPTCNNCNLKYPLENSPLGGNNFLVPSDYPIPAKEDDD